MLSIESISKTFTLQMTAECDVHSLHANFAIVHLPYQLLSDEKLEMVKALSLPTFEFNGMTLIKRLTLAVEDGKIVQVW